MVVAAVVAVLGVREVGRSQTMSPQDSLEVAGVAAAVLAASAVVKALFAVIKSKVEEDVLSAEAVVVVGVQIVDAAAAKARKYPRGFTSAITCENLIFSILRTPRTNASVSSSR